MPEVKKAFCKVTRVPEKIPTNINARGKDSIPAKKKRRYAHNFIFWSVKLFISILAMLFSFLDSGFLLISRKKIAKTIIITAGSITFHGVQLV